MKLVVGLGNIGKEYEETRHNVGFMVIDRILQDISQSLSMENKLKAFCVNSNLLKTVFAKPTTMMNDSGESVRSIVGMYKIKPSNLWVIHDDLDLELGKFKIQKGKGPKDHNGLLSIYEKTGFGDFWHVRIGISGESRKVKDFKFDIISSLLPFKKKKPRLVSGERYVLHNFSDDEKLIVLDIVKKVSKELIERLKA